ncbi:MAG: hypothetical protein IMZ52_10395 [Actinobacteria bacterium]|nr:hypothetical protein [Actinomycetota bacterium]
MVSTAEKIRVLDYFIKKYPEKTFLKDIRKTYEQKSDEEIDMKKKSHMSANLDEKEMLAGLKPGECVDVEMRDDEDELMFKAKVCKTKAK